MAHTHLIPLTETLQVVSGAHILYVYEDQRAYLDNAVSFITTGITQDQRAIFMVDPNVSRNIVSHLSPDERAYVHFVDVTKFYLQNEDFDVDLILNSLHATVETFVKEKRSVRLWGEVTSGWSIDAESTLVSYETAADIAIGKLKRITVCAYNGHFITASVQTKLMRSHPYLMTDEALVPSALYRDPNQHAPLPALSSRARLESEMEAIRRKLDVAHVVSHEVRNPLTVIRAYAGMLRSDESAPDRLAKLDKILDYCTVIDHELTHIMTTEQMLMTNSLWTKRLIRPVPVLLDVIDIMSAKARTQNIRFEHDLSIPDTALIVANNMGLRLIVSNLISNAIKYSNEDTVVRLLAQIETNELVIRVVDQGIGIPSQSLDTLFEKYERADDERSGQGIGLFVVKEITEAFGGTVTAQSQVNLGSTFQINLPCAFASAWNTDFDQGT